MPQTDAPRIPARIELHKGCSMNAIDTNTLRRFSAVTEEHWQLHAVPGVTPAQADTGSSERGKDSDIPQVAVLGYN